MAARSFVSEAVEWLCLQRRYGGPAGASATINREPGQARKGAAAAVDLGAGMLLVGSPPILFFPSRLSFSLVQPR